ncbi:hypothetical protein [Staphylococcus gallinarum]|uniref:hypothetical protein n=1 Tax=Staphylococcus gallinarum TaxID=1293 RepID=UPI000D1DD438|nr:hypothetical protein [Staphylococcus gallinarum]PTK95473.1 hypothetical protein BUZ05_02955 [Staphylococcus gallinarum]PTK96380.1 hypothetical protein BUZ13_01130 [Staphylococcus gallinarum]PTL18493.1 hypothetical protein BUZ08_00860 [Staphylococcus gallinarum]RIO80050.1 hypothetical protein BUZ07_03950 [Staphylococcus gallinarum]RIO86312.1 hypothetical protein BUZ06_13390 [Staphylococcus gallinarum]
MKNNLNNEIEETIANDMAYTFSRNMMMSNKESRAMVEIAQRYGLSEKQAVLMILEFGSIQGSGE